MIKKPEILRPGDKIGVIAPGGIFKQEAFEAGLQFLKTLELEPVLGAHVQDKDFIYAGTLRDRVQDTYKMLSRKDIKAVWSVRGGYGCYAVAQELAQCKIPSHPKVFLGMSDITAIQLLLNQKWKWPAIHSPLLDRIGVDRSPALEKEIMKNTLLDKEFHLKITQGLSSLAKSGSVKAPVTGGNLSLLMVSLGTKWEIQTRGKILFMEEIGERAYRLDRMLWQLEQAGKFDDVKGVVLGDFTECQEPDGAPLFRESLTRFFGRRKFPVLAGVESGHGAMRMAFPLGVEVSVVTKGNLTFEVLESYAKN